MKGRNRSRCSPFSYSDVGFLCAHCRGLGVNNALDQWGPLTHGHVDT